MDILNDDDDLVTSIVGKGGTHTDLQVSKYTFDVVVEDSNEKRMMVVAAEEAEEVGKLMVGPDLFPVQIKEG